MNSIDAFERDVILQTQFLQIFRPQTPISEISQKNSIFCGSGDSLAAAFLAEAFSNFKVRAADPLDLLKNPQILKKHNVFLISISGNTISNIKVAKIAQKSIAITSNPSSKLAKTCSRIIHLDFPNSDVFTGGTISFLQSALTCISLVTDFKMPNSVKIFKTALKNARKIKFGKRIFILGNFYTYPVAMYFAAKFFELHGTDAHYERIEQFSHMGLFSIHRGDTVIILEEKNKYNAQLVKNLQKVGLKVFQPTLKTTDKISQFLFYTFVAQIVTLLEAKRKKQKDCNFITSKNLRKASNNMIY